MGILDRFIRRQPAMLAAEAAPHQAVATGGAPARRRETQSDGVIARTLATIKRLSGYPQAGRFAGFLEPNVEISPNDLFGLSPRQLGILYRMRWAHPVISAGMDFAQNAVESIEYGLEPANKSLAAYAARNAVEREILQTPGFSLSRFVGTVWDNAGTYGFAALETTTPDGAHIVPRLIPPHLINMWLLEPDYIGLQGASVISGGTVRTLPASQFSWYGRQAFPGHWYGVSRLRKLLSLFAAYEQDLRTYLDQQRLARGILYSAEKEGLANQLSVDRMIDYLSRYHQGEDFPIIVPAGMTLEVASVVNPSLSHFKDMLGYYDTAFREALMSSLGSLGINGEGARSLGESFRVVDAQRLKAALDAFLRELNGETCERSNFMQLLTINAGYSPDLTPRIVCAGQIGVDMTQQRTDLVQLTNAGLVTREDLGQENIDRLIEGLGLSVQDRAPVAPTTIPSGTVSRSDGDVRETSPLVQTRARRMPNDVANRILDGLLRHEATPDVTIDPELIVRARAWVRGVVPSDEDVIAAMQWLASPEGRAGITARAGEPEWLLAQIHGGRAGAGYWQGEYTRRGLQVAQ